MSIPIQELSNPFPPDQIRQRKGSFGKQLSYIEAASVIQRLNNALEGEWSFTILSMDIEPDHVIVRGRLTIGTSLREQYGASRITRQRDSGEIVNIGDDLKSAASDCLKKCATLAGVGLHLYTDSGGGNGNSRSSLNSNNDHEAGVQARSNGHGNGNGNGNRDRTTGFKGNGRTNGDTQPDRVSNEMIATLVQSARDANLPQRDLINLARDMFDSTLSQLTPAQADDLITLINTPA